MPMNKTLCGNAAILLIIIINLKTKMSIDKNEINPWHIDFFSLTNTSQYDILIIPYKLNYTERISA